MLKIKDKKPSKKFAMFSLKNSKPGEPLLLHEEPIYLDNKIIGSIHIDLITKKICHLDM